MQQYLNFSVIIFIGKVVFFFLCQVRACIGQQILVGTVKWVGIIMAGTETEVILFDWSQVWGQTRGLGGKAGAIKVCLDPGGSLLPSPSTGTEAWAEWQVGQRGSLGTSEEEQDF